MVFVFFFNRDSPSSGRIACRHPSPCLSDQSEGSSAPEGSRLRGARGIPAKASAGLAANSLHPFKGGAIQQIISSARDLPLSYLA